MDILFSNSKNNQLTCTVDNKYLHSSFNPISEAEKFVLTINCDFNPSNIIITGPGISYIADFLREKFPTSKLIAIQYNSAFNEFNSKWDNTITINSNTSIESLAEQIFSYIGDEDAFSTLSISYKPSETLFQNEYLLTWKGIKAFLEKAEQVISTRVFFNKKWTKNIITFFSLVKNFSTIEKINGPIIITASGTSLNNSLSYLKKYRNNYTLVALSSSISYLLQNSLKPDFCISTDGGYWANYHLRALLQNKDIPLVITPESSCPKKILSNGKIIPLSYTDSISDDIFSFMNINCLKGKRNGTVSGTAVELCLSLTKDNVYFCGLELDKTIGFSHSQPNELEKSSQVKDSRIKTLNTRITPNSFNQNNILLYRNWFETRNSLFYKRVFRLITKSDKLKPFNNLESILWNDELFSKKAQIHFSNISIKKEVNSLSIYLTEVKKNILKKSFIKHNYHWFSSCSLIEFLQWKRSLQSEQKSVFSKLVQTTLNEVNDLEIYNRNLEKNNE